MKTNLFKMAAIAAVVFAQTAGAQSFAGRMNMEVPFAFQAGKAHLAAGNYQVTMTNTIGGTAMIQLGNLDTGFATQVASPGPFRKDYRTNGEGSVVFSCVKENCVLQAIRVQDKEFGTGMKNKMTAADRERIYTLKITPRPGRSAE